MTITITFNDGKQWRINRGILKTLAAKCDDGIRPILRWCEPRELDVMMSLVRMEREGMIIDDELNLSYR